ncbi:MAG: hypothetical protein WDA59_08165 [Methanofastidiosum sp.]|jgi:hypothetical protein|nr:hypothetical protein [Candidatus Izemoplasmatales bacterium]
MKLTYKLLKEFKNKEIFIDPELIVDFEINNENTFFETIDITKVILSPSQIDWLLEYGSIDTPDWEGKIIARDRYTGEIEATSEPAFGGYGNRNGVDELGVIHITLDDILGKEFEVENEA